MSKLNDKIWKYIRSAINDIKPYFTNLKMAIWGWFPLLKVIVIHPSEIVEDAWLYLFNS